MYFACEWIISPINGHLLAGIFNKLEELDCELSVSDIQRAPSALFVLNFYVRVPSVRCP